MTQRLKFYAYVRQFGNSRGVIIPKPLLDNIDSSKRILVTIEENNSILNEGKEEVKHNETQNLRQEEPTKQDNQFAEKQESMADNE